MSPPLTGILSIMSNIAKENQTGPIRCRGCYRSTGIVRHGYYERYLFDSNEKIKVQRYLCRNPECGCMTFSILPHPFLRYIRLPLCFLFLLLDIHQSETNSLSSLARQAGLQRPTAKRAVRLALRLQGWLDGLGLWPDGGGPCLSPKRRWTDLNRALSWAFFPNRYRRKASHTI